MLLWIRFFAVPAATLSSQQKNKNKHLDAPRDLALFNTQSTHTTNRPVWWVCLQSGYSGEHGAWSQNKASV